MVGPFSFKLNSRMTFGAGTARQLPDLLQQRHLNRVAILVDAGVATSNAYAELRELLATAGVLNFEYVNTVVEPTFDEVDAITNEFRRLQFDCLVTLGGGSTIDIAKGVSILLTNAGKAIDYRGYGLVKNPGLPLFVLPTTAGSGSEVTPNASYFDPVAVKKLGINSELYLPQQVILDPVLTVSCPAKATSSAGLDALVHTLESFTARSATPTAKLFALSAFRLIYPSLERAIQEPTDLDARGNMLLGAYYAGIALMNSASGPAGVLSYPLGVRYKVPHGFAGAVFLPAVVRFNIERGYFGYGELFDTMHSGSNRSYLGGPPTDSRVESMQIAPMHVEQKNWEFLKALRQLCERAGAPLSLHELGVREAEIRSLAEEAFKNRTKSAQQNPVDIDANALETIARSVFTSSLPEADHRT